MITIQKDVGYIIFIIYVNRIYINMNLYTPHYREIVDHKQNCLKVPILMKTDQSQSHFEICYFRKF